MKKEIGFEIKREHSPHSSSNIMRNSTARWRERYRSRAYIKELERGIEKQRSKRAKNYLRKFNELVSTAGSEIAENNFKTEIEKWDKINQINGKKRAMDVLLKAAGSFLTGEVTYIHLGHLPSLSVG